MCVVSQTLLCDISGEKIQLPPISLFCSKQTTSGTPACNKFFTAVMPEQPAPITATRAGWLGVLMHLLFWQDWWLKGRILA